MAEDDKYPDESGRRRFVKGVVGSAALTSIGAATAGTINTMTSTRGVGGGATTFVGIENTDGPAPRGMPMIPVRVDDNGALKGYWPKVQTVQQEGRTVKIAKEKLGGQTYSNQWFQYCGVETYPGLDPDADQDNYFRYAEGADYAWQQEKVSAGNKANVSDFANYETWGNGIGKSGIGKPASVTWRSQGVPASKTMPVQILRIPPDDVRQMKNKLDENMTTWLNAAMEENFIAWLNKCTHFCCVPGFKKLAGSANFDAANEVYCQCHQSVYDPYRPIERQFTAFPRPEE